MKKFAFAAAALILGTAGASAADMAARPYTKAPVAIASVYNWTGFYIGADVGYGWGRSTGSRYKRGWFDPDPVQLQSERRHRRRFRRL